MPIRAGFAETDITPAQGLRKIGWLKLLHGRRVRDPLAARAAVLESGGSRLAFVQLDTLCIRWTQTDALRRRLAERHGIPAEAVMVAATHSHGGPAVANAGDVRREESYLEELVPKLEALVAAALARLEPVELGFHHTFEWGLAWNRRVVMRDGTVKTHGTFKDPNALCLEGPIDPEVAVLAARRPDGSLAGCLVNFACHPTHSGGTDEWSAGYPGALAAAMKTRGCPVTLFLNGACGNIHHSNPAEGGASLDTETFGGRLAEAAARALADMRYGTEARLGAASRTIQLPFRRVTDDEVAGKVRGAQRFIDPAIYDRGMPELLRKIQERKTNPAEVQALFINDLVWIGIPAEYFVEHGLRIKEGAWPRHALVVSHANGMVGYVPTRQAFERGGYETTFGPTSRLAPEAGDLLAEAALALIR
jgi:hypothetical protein